MTKEDLDSWKYDCTDMSIKSIPYIEEYPTKPIEEYYLDQLGFNRSYYGDRVFSSIVTWYGIKCMDSWYSHYIKNIDESPYTKDELTMFIKSNPHLHNIIKTNLLNNLKTI